MNPKTALIILGNIFVLFIIFSSFAVHEFVHFAQDGFANPNVCFFGYKYLTNSTNPAWGWYETDNTNISEVLAYSIQIIYLLVMFVLGFKLMSRVYDKL
jgi:hypothetical protein